MTSTFIYDLFRQVSASSTAMAADALKVIFSSVWSSLAPYWPYFLGGFFILLVIATIKFASGDWSAMGSLIYHIAYFGILATVISIKGIDIVFDPFFDLICAILYRLSYWLTGLILKKLGIRLR